MNGEVRIPNVPSSVLGIIPRYIKLNSNLSCTKKSSHMMNTMRLGTIKLSEKLYFEVPVNVPWDL